MNELRHHPKRHHLTVPLGRAGSVAWLSVAWLSVAWLSCTPWLGCAPSGGPAASPSDVASEPGPVPDRLVTPPPPGEPSPIEIARREALVGEVPEASATAAIPPPTEKRRLDNGIPVHFEPIPGSPLAELRLDFSSDDANRTAAAWLGATVLLHGGAGANGAAALGPHYDSFGERPTVVRGSSGLSILWRVPPARVPEALELLTQALTSPHFGQFEALQWTLSSSVAARVTTDPRFVVKEALLRVIHPWSGLPEGVTAAEIAAVRLAECQAWRRSQVRPQKLELSVRSPDVRLESSDDSLTVEVPKDFDVALAPLGRWEGRWEAGASPIPAATGPRAKSRPLDDVSIDLIDVDTGDWVWMGAVFADEVPPEVFETASFAGAFPPETARLGTESELSAVLLNGPRAAVLALVRTALQERARALVVLGRRTSLEKALSGLGAVRVRDDDFAIQKTVAARPGATDEPDDEASLGGEGI